MLQYLYILLINFMKFSSVYILSLSILYFIFTAYQTYAQEGEEQNYFVVTAYYSPLPDQENYLTWNYEDEIILNGRGIAGASGKKVFQGMLAAPSLYSFWTKIELDGLGVGEVSDRGGAIVPAGQRGYEHDRIDIWMWYGDEWLRRAIYWGKREIAGKVIDSSRTVNLDYSTVPNPLWVTENLKKNTTNTTTEIQQTPSEDVSIYDISISSSSSHLHIAELQTLLSDLGYLHTWYTAWKFEQTSSQAIMNLQLKNNIITNSSSIGAGIYGPKTRKKIKELYDKYLQEQEEYNLFALKINDMKQDSLDKAQLYIDSIWDITYGNISTSVRELQKTLASLGYFHQKDTAIFGAQTQNALIEYQLSKGLISEQTNTSAGIFGNKTREKLIEDMSYIYLSQELLNTQNLKKYIGYVYNENKKLLETTWSIAQTIPKNRNTEVSKDSLIDGTEYTIKKI